MYYLCVFDYMYTGIIRTKPISVDVIRKISNQYRTTSIETRQIYLKIEPL